MTDILHTTFSNAYLLMKNRCVLTQISLKFSPNESADNEPEMVQQAIIWTNDAPFMHVYMRHSTSMSY